MKNCKAAIKSGLIPISTAKKKRFKKDDIKFKINMLFAHIGAFTFDTVLFCYEQGGNRDNLS